MKPAWDNKRVIRHQLTQVSGSKLILGFGLLVIGQDIANILNYDIEGIARSLHIKWVLLDVMRKQMSINFLEK
jgi:hypothetical protein